MASKKVESKKDKNKIDLKVSQALLRIAYSEGRGFPKDELQKALKLAYKNTGDFYANDQDDESDLNLSIVKDIFKVCVSCAENLLPFIVFVNDVLKVPPTKTFLDIYRRVCIRDSAKFKSQKHSPEFQEYRDKIESGKDDAIEAPVAQKIGAFWGFIFQNILAYERYPKNVRIGTLGVKTASRFEKKDIDINKEKIDIDKEEFDKEEYEKKKKTVADGIVSLMKIRKDLTSNWDMMEGEETK